MSRSGTAPYECAGCKAKFDLKFIKPNVMKPTYFKTECPKCESGLQGHVVMPANRKFPNHVQIHTSIIKPSQKLIDGLASGEFKGDTLIKGPGLIT